MTHFSCPRSFPRSYSAAEQDTLCNTSCPTPWHWRTVQNTLRVTSYGKFLSSYGKPRSLSQVFPSLSRPQTNLKPGLHVAGFHGFMPSQHVLNVWVLVKAFPAVNSYLFFPYALNKFIWLCPLFQCRNTLMHFLLVLLHDIYRKWISFRPLTVCQI